MQTFGGRCKHLIFCSTVCTYGVKVPDRVLVMDNPGDAAGSAEPGVERVVESILEAAERRRP